MTGVVPDTYEVKLIGRGLGLPLSVGSLALSSMVVDVPIAKADQCGDASFAGPAPAPSCVLRATGRSVVCR